MTQNIDSYFENNKGFRANPFRKCFLTDEERKESFRWYGSNFVFFVKHADLSDTGVEIYRNENYSYPYGHCLELGKMLYFVIAYSLAFGGKQMFISF